MTNNNPSTKQSISSVMFSKMTTTHRHSGAVILMYFRALNAAQTIKDWNYQFYNII